MFFCFYSAICLPSSVTDEPDDSLDDLLNDVDEERTKSGPPGKAGKQPPFSPTVQKKEEEGQNPVLYHKKTFLCHIPHCRKLFRNSDV